MAIGTMTRTESKTDSSLLSLDRKVFKQHFPDRGFKVQHNLCERAEFSLERLVQLAQRLPEKEVEYFTGKVPVNQDPKNHPKNGLSIVETVRRIEENGS